MEWARFRRLVDDTVARLKAVEAAIRRFIERGDRCGMSPLTLWDYFAISTPSIPARAGYCGVECEQMVEVFDRPPRERFGEQGQGTGPSDPESGKPRD